MVISRGSFVSGIASLCGGTGLSKQKIRTSLKKLKSTGEITLQTTNRYSIISVKNWDKYQSANTPANKPLTNKQQTNNKRITTNNNVNNVNNENKGEKGKPSKLEFEVPSMKDVLDYFRPISHEKNLDLTRSMATSVAENYLASRTESDWIKATGKQVKNWKLDFRTWVNRHIANGTIKIKGEQRR
jgi:hypothetical protein